jgi:RNA polymerase sigma-70 factor (ECF subfamily)
MEQFAKGLNKNAFEQLVHDFSPLALALAKQKLNDPELAEDAVQETFVRIIRKRRQYVSTHPFSHWFYTILRNICIDILRKQQRDKDVVKHFAHHVRYLFRKESPSENVTLFKLLAPHERDVLELRIIHSMTFEDIAIALNISQEAAKKRAQRGLRKLRKRLEEHQYQHREAV